MKIVLKKKILLIGFLLIGVIFFYTEAQETSTGDLSLEILQGNSCCMYGTSVVFGNKDISFSDIEFSGDFLNALGGGSRGCRDLEGINTGWVMYISMSGDMENERGNKISASNVSISFDSPFLVGGNCDIYNGDSVDMSLDTQVSIVEKDGNIASNYGKICEIHTSNVVLKVVTDEGQAPGNYKGTLVIDLPNFASSFCDESGGIFYDSETDGLLYEGNLGSVGVTSNGGSFKYKAGELITFKVGTVTLGNPVVPAANGSVFVTDLFGLARADITDANVIELGRLLQGLDTDENPENGIVIDPSISSQFTENNNITELDIDSKLTILSKPVRTKREVVQHLDNTLKDKLGEITDIAYPEILTGVSFDQLMLEVEGEGPFMLIYSKAIDGLGNTYMVGSFESTAIFGSTTLVSSGRTDVVVIKKNNSGDYERAIRGGGTDVDQGNGIAIDGSGNIYVVGNFRGTATFGSIPLVSNGSDDVYIAKIDPDGNWLRAIKGGGTSSDYGNGIAIDGLGNSYIVGRYYGTINFGSNTLANNGGSDVFVVKIDSDGIYQQAIRGGSTSHEYGNGIAVDGLGNIYLVGEFSYDTIFGSTTLESRWYYKDNYLAKLNSDLQRVSAVVIEGVEIESIFSDEQNSLYVGGTYLDAIYIGSNLIYPYLLDPKEENTILYKMVPRDDSESVLYETLPETPQR